MPHQLQHARRVRLGHVVGKVEVEVLVHHAHRLGELAVLQGVAAERERLVEGRERIAQCAVALAGQQHEALLVRRHPLGLADLAQACHGAWHRNAAEVEPLAPRQDGGQHLVRLRRCKNKEGVRRRLLQGLQQGVEGLVGEHMDLVQDIDLLLVALGRDAHLLAQLADVVDLVVGGRVHLEDVEAASLLERDAGVALAARLGPVLALLARRLAVDGLRQNAGGGRLADAARPAKQVGVRQAIELDRVLERIGDVLLGHHLLKERRPVLACGNEVVPFGHDNCCRRREEGVMPGGPGRIVEPVRPTPSIGNIRPRGARNQLYLCPHRAVACPVCVKQTRHAVRSAPIRSPMLDRRPTRPPACPVQRPNRDYCDASGIGAAAPSPIGTSVVRRRTTRAMASGLKAPW